MLDTSSLHDNVICRYFLPVSDLSFQSLRSVFSRTRFLILMKPKVWGGLLVYLFVFSFTGPAFGVVSKSSSPNPTSHRFSPIFSRNFRFCISYLDLWSILSYFLSTQGLGYKIHMDSFLHKHSQWKDYPFSIKLPL